MSTPFVFRPAEQSKWAHLSRTAPNRIVAALEAGVGYTPTNFACILSVVLEGASRKDAHWSRLVDAGLINALCTSVINAKPLSSTSDIAGIGYLAMGFTFSSASSYYSVLDVLHKILRQFSKPPSQTDMNVVQALRKHWSHMMMHIWNHPEQSLHTGPQFASERGIIASLISLILRVDATFISVIDEESDLSVSVLSRYWVHSSGDDTFINTCALVELMNPQSKLIIDYRKQHNLPSSFFDRIMLGGVSSSGFISILINHLHGICGIKGYVEVVLFKGVWIMALSERNQAHTDFLQAACESSTLWLNIFSLLRKSADDDPAECTGASNGLINLMASVINSCVADVSQPLLQRRVSLVKLWANTGFFPALDEVVTNGSLDIQKEDYQLCRDIVAILRHIKHALDHNRSLLPLLSPHFPRQKLSTCLLQISKTIKPNAPTPTDVPSEVNCGVWFLLLQRACHVRSQCGRRGCQRKTTAQCASCKLGYCDVECQKLDWKEHKLPCKLEFGKMFAKKFSSPPIP